MIELVLKHPANQCCLSLARENAADISTGPKSPHRAAEKQKEDSWGVIWL